jgi:competence protein ComEA
LLTFFHANKKICRRLSPFSRRERLGIIALLGLIAMLYLLPGILKKQTRLEIYPGSVLSKLVDTTSVDEGEKEPFQGKYRPAYPGSATPFASTSVFKFDPNSLNAEGWQKLGLREKTIKTILNYTSKGGRFRQTEDLKKIWGMPEGFYERVKDYVDIEKVEEKESGDTKKDFRKFEKKNISIDINEADTTAWIALPGIGSKLAARIVNFREKLGGFYSVDQVGETFGLPDSTFQKIKTFLNGGGSVKKININTLTKDELKTHPYIRWNLANAIVEYRNQHGKFLNIESIKNIAAINEDVFRKIAPYLATE